MTERSQPGPDRNADDLSHLTVDQVIPVDPIEVADSLSLEQIQARLMGQYALVEGLQIRRDELLAKLDFETNQLSRWQEALLLASDKNPGAPQ